MNIEKYTHEIKTGNLEACVTAAEIIINLAFRDDRPSSNELKIRDMAGLLNDRLEYWKGKNSRNSVNFTLPSLGQTYDLLTGEKQATVDNSLPLRSYLVHKNRPSIQGDGWPVKGDGTTYTLQSIHIDCRQPAESVSVAPVLLGVDEIDDSHLRVISSLGEYFMPKFRYIEHL